ncbi:MAG: hypothetical protein NWF04_09180 [Candidatus Bathyarchaeota archaeon]|nr:hypothetical protein [Candidatus Bathyarchaeota archaeon]
MANAEIEGNTLNVYTYVAKEGRPVGTRDVTRGANLSSPSVAHRHLLKLEALGLIQKTAYGDYMLKEKVDVSGYVWVGKNLVPRLIFYSLFFLGAFIAEITLTVSFLVMGSTLEISFLFLTAMTAIAMTLFLTEGIKMHKKIQPKPPQQTGNQN